MKFVTTCLNCFKSFVPSTGHEWCRPCAGHFTKMLPDSDEWVISKDPIRAPVSSLVQMAVDKAIANGARAPHDTAIFVDNPQDPQPDATKVEAAIARMKALEIEVTPDPPISSFGMVPREAESDVDSSDPAPVFFDDPVRTNAKHIPSEDLESIEDVQARELEFKSERPTATETALRNEAKPGWWEQLEVAPGNDPLSSEPGAIDYSTLAPGRAVIANRPVYISPAMDDIITKHVAAVQEKLQRELRKILRKGIETNDLRYASKEYNLGLKCEKSEKF